MVIRPCLTKISIRLKRRSIKLNCWELSVECVDPQSDFCLQFFDPAPLFFGCAYPTLFFFFYSGLPVYCSIFSEAPTTVLESNGNSCMDECHSCKHVRINWWWTVRTHLQRRWCMGHHWDHAESVKASVCFHQRACWIVWMSEIPFMMAES